MKKPKWLDVVTEKFVFNAVPGTMAATFADPFGVKFKTLTSGGVKPEGEMVSEWFSTKDEAWHRYRHQLELTTRDATTVFFRAAPEMVEKDGVFNVYSRLSVWTA